MKVGILTFHRVPNVGAFLQCDSLVSAVRNLGHEVEVIDYFPAVQQKLYQLNGCNQLIRAFRYPRSIPGAFRAVLNRRTHLNIAREDIYTLPLGSLTSDVNELTKLDYDRIILGSDEIWNLNNPIMNQDLSYAGVHFDCESLCTYAPSFGSVDSAEQIPAAMRKSLAQIKHLSVRDHNSARLLESLGLKATQVVDPTLLEGRAPNGISSPNSGTEIVIYGAPVGNEHLTALQNFASRRGCSLRSVIYPQHPSVPHTPGLSAKAFLCTFREARAIVTTTFHGCIFASLAGKPFAAVNPGEKLNKIKGVLGTLGIEDRLVLNSEGVEDLLSRSIDTDSLNDRLEVVSAKSIEFLRNALA